MAPIRLMKADRPAAIALQEERRLTNEFDALGSIGKSVAAMQRFGIWESQ